MNNHCEFCEDEPQYRFHTAAGDYVRWACEKHLKWVMRLIAIDGREAGRQVRYPAGFFAAGTL